MQISISNQHTLCLNITAFKPIWQHRLVYGGLTLQQLKHGYLHLRFSDEFGWQLIQSDQSARAMDIHYSTLVARHFVGFAGKPHGGKIIRQWLCQDSFCDTQQLGQFIRLLRY